MQNRRVHDGFERSRLSRRSQCRYVICKTSDGVHHRPQTRVIVVMVENCNEKPRMDKDGDFQTSYVIRFVKLQGQYYSPVYSLLYISNVTTSFTSASTCLTPCTRRQSLYMRKMYSTCVYQYYTTGPEVLVDLRKYKPRADSCTAAQTTQR